MYFPITDGPQHFGSNWAKFLVIFIQTMPQTIARECRWETVLCWKWLTNTMQNNTFKSYRSSEKIVSCLPRKLALKWELLPDTPWKRKKEGRLVMPTEWICFEGGDISLWLMRHLSLLLETYPGVKTVVGEGRWWQSLVHVSKIPVSKEEPWKFCC